MAGYMRPYQADLLLLLPRLPLATHPTSLETSFTYYIKAEPEKAQQADDGGSSDASDEEADDESVGGEDAVDVVGDDEDPYTSTVKISCERFGFNFIFCIYQNMFRI